MIPDPKHDVDVLVLRKTVGEFINVLKKITGDLTHPWCVGSPRSATIKYVIPELDLTVSRCWFKAPHPWLLNVMVPMAQITMDFEDLLMESVFVRSPIERGNGIGKVSVRIETEGYPPVVWYPEDIVPEITWVGDIERLYQAGTYLTLLHSRDDL